MNVDPPVLVPSCLHLRHKMMYVDDRQSLPGTVDDRSTTRVYWCTRTMDQLGPDGRVVNTKTCCSSRSCFACGVRTSLASQSI